MLRSTRRRTGVGGLVAVLALGAIGACSGPASPVAGSTPRFDARAAAAKIRALGAISIVGRAHVATPTAAIRGTIRYRPSRVLEQIPVNSGAYLATVQYRRLGGAAWIRRAVVRESGVISFGIPLLVLRSSQQPPFVAVPKPDDGIAARFSRPYDPALLLDAIAASNVAQFHAVGGTRATFATRLPESLAATIGVRSVTVSVDAHGRPVQIGFVTASMLQGRYTVDRARTSPPVSAPPTAQIEDASRPLPDAIGAYVPVFRGSAAGIPVTISRAPGADDWTCWKVASSPEYRSIEAPRPGSGGVCVPPVLDGSSDDERFAIPIDADATTPYDLIGMVTPPGSKVSVELVNGATMALEVDPSGLAVFAGAAQPAAALITITTPGGTALVCGPGPINSAADVAAITNPESVRGAPWNCLAKDAADQVGG